MTPEKDTQSRADSVRQRRSQSTTTRASTASSNLRRPARASTPVVSRTTSSGRVSAARPAVAGRKSKPRAQKRYNVALPMGLTRTVTMPELAIHLGARWVSGTLSLLMVGMLFLMWSMDPFIVRTATVSGNQRLAVSDINSVLGVVGQSVVLAMPEQLEYNLRNAFPDLKDVSVNVGFPSTITVNVVERVPLVAWQHDNKVSWIDAEGIAFPPRGSAEALIPVLALGTPPLLSDALQTASLTPGAQQLLLPDTVRALQSLLPFVPEGTALIYDPNYGLGWNDPRGWQAYFGTEIDDLALKVQMYQTIVDNLMQRGITPTMISVEYPDAPFYRAAKQPEQ